MQTSPHPGGYCQYRSNHVQVCPGRINDVTGKHSVRIVSTKTRKKGLTVALAAKGSGEKLPALIIFKELNGQLGPKVRQLLVIPDNVQVTASTNSWMTAHLYHWWLCNVQ